jgi:acetyl-CoA carboxylase carboxyltransferase component
MLLLLLLVVQVPKVTVIIGGSFGAGNYGELICWFKQRV